MIEDLLSRTKGPGYDCASFAAEVWERITGRHIDLAHGVLALRGFRRVGEPVSPCLVLMGSGVQPTHVGVYYNGRVIHLNEHGVENVPPMLATRFLGAVRYYADGNLYQERTGA